MENIKCKRCMHEVKIINSKKIVCSLLNIKRKSNKNRSCEHWYPSIHWLAKNMVVR